MSSDCIDTGEGGESKEDSIETQCKYLLIADGTQVSKKCTSQQQ